MARPVRKHESSNRGHKSPYGDGQGPERKYWEFSQRLAEAANASGFNAAALARQLDMTSGTFSRYWNGERLPPADTLVDLSLALGVDPAWLVRGTRNLGHNQLWLAEDADWIAIPEYDLHHVTADIKGEILGETPFRRDWLNRAFGTEKNLWLARMLWNYTAAGLAEGDEIVLRDIKVEELLDRHLCIWRADDTGQLIVGRFSTVREHSVWIDDDGEYWVNRVGAGTELKPVGRILGRPLAPIR